MSPPGNPGAMLSCCAFLSARPGLPQMCLRVKSQFLSHQPDTRILSWLTDAVTTSKGRTLSFRGWGKLQIRNSLNTVEKVFLFLFGKVKTTRPGVTLTYRVVLEDKLFRSVLYLGSCLNSVYSRFYTLWSSLVRSYEMISVLYFLDLWLRNEDPLTMKEHDYVLLTSSIEVIRKTALRRFFSRLERLDDIFPSWICS